MGFFAVQVSEREDKLLAEQMAKLNMQNEEVGGDDDSEEEEDTGMGDIDLEQQSEIQEETGDDFAGLGLSLKRLFYLHMFHCTQCKLKLFGEW